MIVYSRGAVQRAARRQARGLPQYRWECWVCRAEPSVWDAYSVVRENGIPVVTCGSAYCKHRAVMS